MVHWISILAYIYNGDDLVSYTNPNGQTATFSYDMRHNLTTLDPPGPGVITLAYDEKGDLTRVTDLNGHDTTISYDDYGNPRAITNALGATTMITNTILGQPVVITDPTGGQVQISYDEAGRLVQTVAPAGNIYRFTYDGNGNLIVVTDPEGQRTSYTYDAQFNLVSVRDLLGHTTSYTYDANDRLTAITDANGRVRAYEYDTLGRLIRRTDPLGRQATFYHDPNGNLTRVTRNDGTTVRYAYDALNRLTGIDYPDDPDITYVYDPLGNLTRVAQGGWSETYQYDAQNRLADVGGSGYHLVSEYDNVGNRTHLAVTVGGNHVYDLNYTYDAADRLKAVVESTGGQSAIYDYDQAGRVTNVTYGNGAHAAYRYNANGWPVRIEHRSAGAGRDTALTYTYDSRGNTIRIGAAILDPRSWVKDLEYNAAGWLTRETYPRYAVEYTYDAVGNRTGMTRGGTTETYIYDAANQLLSAGNTSYTYDENGNVVERETSYGRYVYSYNDAGQLIGLTTPGGVTYAMRYDPFGRLVASDGGTYVYDGNDLVFMSAEGQEQAYVYGNGRLLARRADDFGLGSIYYHGDARGSVRHLSDAAGRLRDTYSEDAFGRPEMATGADPNVYRFLGQWGIRQPLPGTDSYQMGARRYDPTVGRFLSPDPLPGNLRTPITLNGYVYARNNPYRYVDPTGRRAQIITGAFGWMASFFTSSAARLEGVVLNAPLPGGVIAHLPVSLQTRFERMRTYSQFAEDVPRSGGVESVADEQIAPSEEPGCRQGPGGG